MDGSHLKKGLELATELIEKEVEFINAINVYPVADGDTGTNMFKTIRGIVNSIKDADTSHAGKLAERIAEASLETARGNSGVILSQFFWGFYEGIGDAEVIDGHLIPTAFKEGKEWAYRAVSKPVEGTILTAMRGAAEGAQRVAKTSKSTSEVLNGAYQASLSALEATPEMLRKLGKPKVIDSGAYGFTLIVEGLVRALGVGVNGYRVRGMQVKRESGEESNLFCANFLINLRNGVSAEKIRSLVEGYGDSIVVVCSGSRAKVHVHTEDPQSLRKLLQSFGNVAQERVERIW